MRQCSSCPLPARALSTRHGHQGHRTGGAPVLTLCSEKEAQEHREGGQRTAQVGTLRRLSSDFSELSSDLAFCM